MEITKEQATEVKTALEAVVPYVSASYSDLGGADRAAIMVCLSLDARETWVNNIRENSRLMHLSIRGNKVEQFSLQFRASKRFRKATVKTMPEAIAKIIKYLNEIMLDKQSV